eukprot:1158443-Pelagomonas_calceolata.AAC.14
MPKLDCPLEGRQKLLKGHAALSKEHSPTFASWLARRHLKAGPPSGRQTEAFERTCSIIQGTLTTFCFWVGSQASQGQMYTSLATNRITVLMEEIETLRKAKKEAETLSQVGVADESKKGCLPVAGWLAVVADIENLRECPMSALWHGMPCKH